MVAVEDVPSRDAAGERAARVVLVRLIKDPPAQRIIGVLDAGLQSSAVADAQLRPEQSIVQIEAIGPGLARRDVDALGGVAFAVVEIVPGAVGGEAIGRAGDIAGRGAVAVERVAVIVRTIRGDLIGGIVPISLCRSVARLGGYAVAGVERVRIADQRSATAMLAGPSLLLTNSRRLHET